MDDTIAAIGTPPGESGIGIIRISGENALNILLKIFVPANRDYLKNPTGRKMTYGNIVDPVSNKIIDEVLCVYMKGPSTYTREDIVEIDCHGGMVPLRRTLELVLKYGARSAGPGEFTKRAFLNGRLDLSQAEAVIDLIKAKTDKTFDVAMDQLEGKFSKAIRAIRNKLMDVLADLTVNIDYPDEDIEELTYERLEKDLKDIRGSVSELIESSETGKIIREGLRVAIIGKPNVGKSSLMNNLLNEARAIVTEIPGTTRDTIEEHLSIGGIPVILTDTAGIRETSDLIEKIGVERSKRSFNEADLVILILDGSESLSEEDLSIIKYIEQKKTIVILNKIDLENVTTKEEIEKLLPHVKVIETSMESQQGLDILKEEIESMVYGGKVSRKDSLLVTNARHKALLVKAESSLGDALDAAAGKEPFELIEIDVNIAYESLGEIIGETAGADIIDEVFSRFCVGK